MIPTPTECERPLLEALIELGGQAETKDVYPVVRKRLTSMTEAEATETLPSGEFKWINRVRWARLNLIKKGQMDSPAWGVWRITDAGRERIEKSQAGQVSAGPVPETAVGPTVSSGPTLVDLHEAYERDFRRQLLERLSELDPYQFEVFAQKLLRAYGFVDVKVTSKSGDGGIDGYGRLRVGLATMRVAFQCKRWEGNIGRPEIDKFRGAISGDFEQGIFFTTSDFTKDAMDASIKRGAVPIVLINGEMIVDIMIRTGFGVERRPLELYFDRLDTIFEDES